jgi:hypothetical protein
VDVLLPEPLVDKTSGTPYPGIDLQRRHRAVPGTGTALNAGVTVREHGTFFLQREDLVRADFQAPAAPDAPGPVQFQSRHSFQVSKTFHRFASII